VADLLECLIQMKALRTSVDRLAYIVGTQSAASRARLDAPLTQLTEAERMYAAALQGLRRPGPLPGITSARVDGADVFGEWAGLRQASLAVLGACTAEDLGARVSWPGRANTTVADLVAIMLARDTEVLGELSRHRPGIRT
jgi:enoyl reductase-like protein